jgi:Fe-S-cluster-containing dehydrogenase component
MRCTGCKSCTVACPFGVIFQDFIVYLDSKCDFCLNTVDRELPACQLGCSHKAVEFREVAEDQEKNIYFVGEHLAVHTAKWLREEPVVKKK